jgi:membrane protein
MSADTAAPPAVTGADGEVDDPTDLSRGDYLSALKATKDEIKRDDVPSMAAGVSFKIFLALFPSLLAAVAIWGFFADPAAVNRYVDNLQGVVPDAALDFIRIALEGVTGTGAGAASAVAIPGILTGLWAASSAAATLVKALNRAYEVEESRGFLKQRGVAFAVVFALLFALVALVLLLVAGPQVQSAVVPEQLQGPIANIAFGAAQVVLALVILVLLFAFIYWVGPNRELPQWQWMSPGAVLGVVGWLVASLGFTLYVQNFGNYGEGSVYAGFGSIIVFLLWLQISMTLLLIGAEFNAEVERIKAQHEALRAGVGMGHLADVPDVVDVTDAALLTDVPAALAPVEATAAAPSPSTSAAPAPSTSAAGTGTAASGRGGGGVGGSSQASSNGASASSVVEPDAGGAPAPYDSAHAQVSGRGALVAGAAAVAAAAAAIVGAVRDRH